MKVEYIEYNQDPRKISDEQVDCIWIQLEKNTKRDSLHSKALLWLDWKVRGQLIRFLESTQGNTPITFLPSMGKIAASYLAVQFAEETNWEVFFKSCEGLQLKKVLLFCENSADAKEAYTYLLSHSEFEFPKTISCTFEVLGDKNA